jgi:hypothetical protein
MIINFLTKLQDIYKHIYNSDSHFTFEDFVRLIQLYDTLSKKGKNEDLVKLLMLYDRFSERDKYVIAVHNLASGLLEQDGYDITKEVPEEVRDKFTIHLLSKNTKLEGE